MFCPYCNSDMKEGIISCGRHAPNGSKEVIFLIDTKKGLNYQIFMKEIAWPLIIATVVERS